MKKEISLDRDSIIEYILLHNKKIQRRDLDGLSVESLVLIKVQVEIENSTLNKVNKLPWS